MANRWRKSGNSNRLYFLGSEITVDVDRQHKIKRRLLTPWKKSYDNPSQCIKKQRHHFADKGLYSQSYGFSRSHVWMWELGRKESWVLKNWCFWTVVLEKTVESLGLSVLKKISPDYSLEGLMLKLKAPILWPPDAKDWFTGKDPDAGKDWRQEEKGMTENEMVG